MINYVNIILFIGVSTLHQEPDFKNKFDNGELIIYYTQSSAEKIIYIKGQVQRKKDGINIPGINIIPEGSNFGTVSDSSGKFTLRVKEVHGKIFFEHTHFKRVILKY
jgi:hypothetical protein